MKLFAKVDSGKMKKGAPPVVMLTPVSGHIVFKTQKELSAWETQVKTRLGLELKGTLGSACETCSAGCTDDCGQV